uniref:Uncharacterized protein n=1 Tax=Parascaris univalens TaxID=6257 RepID=A0A915BKR7_PARUN
IYRYGFEALTINEWSGVRHIPGCFLWSKLNGLSCPKNGAEVIEELNFSESSLWFNIAILFAMCIVIRFIAFIALFVRVLLRK